MITYRKRGVCIRETWFVGCLDSGGTDLLFAYQYPSPVSGAQCRPKHTLVTDLTSTPEDLFAGLSADCRNKVRRAREKDQTCCRALLAREPVARAQFTAIYSELAAAKGLAQLDTRRLALLAEGGYLDISAAYDPEGKILACHANLLVRPRARLLYSVSLFRGVEDTQRRNLVGRANRLLHWDDIIRFREFGYTLFDWGGWCADDSDAERQRINRFKEEFRGRPLQEWDCALPLTIKGRLALWVYGRFRQNG